MSKQSQKTSNGRENDVQINLLVLNRKNIFCEIIFLNCIHKIPAVKFAIFETVGKSIINLINGKGWHAQKQKALPDIRIVDMLFLYNLLH